VDDASGKVMVLASQTVTHGTLDGPRFIRIYNSTGTGNALLKFASSHNRLLLRNSTDTVYRDLQAGEIVTQGTVRAANDASSSIAFEAINHAYNVGALKLGTNYLWVDSSGALRLKASAPTSNTDGTVLGPWLRASTTFDPPSINAGAVATTAVTVTGAAAGDFAVASFSDTSTSNASVVEVSAKVTGADAVTVYFKNHHSAAVNLASGTLRVAVMKAQ
jgi:hypothetical protein